MALVQHYLAGGYSVPSSATRYANLGNGSGAMNSAESISKITHLAGGTLSMLYCRVSTNGSNGTTTVVVRKNSADGNQILTIGAGATGEFEDTTNSDSVVAGDESNYKSVNAGTGTIAFVFICILFAASTNTVIRHITAGASVTFASTTRYTSIAGAQTWNTSEAVTAYTMDTGGTLQGLMVSVGTNARTTTTTFSSRKNAAAGAQSVSVGSGATGFFQDVTNTDSLSIGDTVDREVTTGSGTETLTLSQGVEFVTTDRTTQLIGSALGAVNFAAGTTRWSSISGETTVTSTEVNVSPEVNTPETLSHMNIYLSANTVLATSTIRSRVNSANGQQVISIGTLATGLFEDTTNSDVITVASDQVGMQVVVGAGGTDIQVTFNGMLVSGLTGGGSSYVFIMGGGGSFV